MKAIGEGDGDGMRGKSKQHVHTLHTQYHCDSSTRTKRTGDAQQVIAQELRGWGGERSTADVRQQEAEWGEQGEENVQYVQRKEGEEAMQRQCLGKRNRERKYK